MFYISERSKTIAQEKRRAVAEANRYLKKYHPDHYISIRKPSAKQMRGWEKEWGSTVRINRL